MKRYGILVAALLVTGLVPGILFGGCSGEDSAAVNVVTSTSLIAGVVERVGGDGVSVVNIIPPAQCPGHFDVKPQDIKMLADTDLFIIHNWQGEKFSEELIASADNKKLTVVKIELPGNWMTPPVQREAAGKIAAALAQVAPDNAAAYREAADAYSAELTAKESEIETTLRQVNLASVNVLCDEQQSGFVKWAGLNIIGTYGRPETFTPQTVKDLVDNGREKGVMLVIDNMQTGGEAGKGLAEELGVKGIVLSNFPGGYENTGTWEEAIDKNIALILNAVGNK
ncbi:MAG: zinc ABC transporter substrate-binding protein [Chloroflexota bacterium]